MARIRRAPLPARRRFQRLRRRSDGDTTIRRPIVREYSMLSEFWDVGDHQARVIRAMLRNRELEARRSPTLSGNKYPFAFLVLALRAPIATLLPAAIL